MATQRNLKSGSLPWEDDAAPDNRLRRAQQVTPRNTRNLPGMPLEMDDPDDDAPRPRRRFNEPKTSWWRPASKVGRILIGAGALVAVASLIGGYESLAQFLRRDSRFRITGAANIQSNGLTEVPRRTVLPVFGADIGKNIFFVNLSDRRKQLEQIPWVEQASVMRLLPNQIRVSIVERKPVAFVRLGQQIELVDAKGVLLNMDAATIARHHYSFPVLTGIAAADSQDLRRQRVAVYMRMMADLDSTGQHLSNQISEVDLTDPEDARVLMPEPGGDILAHFGDEQFLRRYQRFQAHIGEWRSQYPNLAAVDLRYDQQVVLKMAGNNTASATVSGNDAPSAAPAPPEKPSPEQVEAARPKAVAAPHRPVHKVHARAAHKSAAAKRKKQHPSYKYAGLRRHTKAAETSGNGQGH